MQARAGWLGADHAARTRTGPRVARPGCHMDFVVTVAKLQAGFQVEARLGSCNVGMYSHTIEK
jgi:hypothetical protein